METQVKVEASAKPILSREETRTELFGKGRYSSTMFELYSDSQRLLGLEQNQALKIAKQYGSDLGRLEAENPSIKFGAFKKKEGTITLKESVTIKGIVLTTSISIAKLCVMAQEMKLYGMKSLGVVKFNENVENSLNKVL